MKAFLRLAQFGLTKQTAAKSVTKMVHHGSGRQLASSSLLHNFPFGPPQVFWWVLRATINFFAPIVETWNPSRCSNRSGHTGNLSTTSIALGPYIIWYDGLLPFSWRKSCKVKWMEQSSAKSMATKLPSRSFFPAWKRNVKLCYLRYLESFASDFNVQKWLIE